ncbi:MAG: hypothetical protein QM736_27785 [Vicinamibacterales bacterium]
MPHFRKLTPNLIVADVVRSLAFYVDVLGFSRGMTVPDAEPFVFASVTSGTVEYLLQRSRGRREGISGSRRTGHRRERHALHRG